MMKSFISKELNFKVDIIFFIKFGWFGFAEMGSANKSKFFWCLIDIKSHFFDLLSIISISTFLIPKHFLKPTMERAPKTFENMLNFISNQPNFPPIFTHTVLLLKRSLKISVVPPSSCEITTYYINIHKENFLKSVYHKKKVVLVWLVSAFVLLTGKTLENLV